MPCYDPANGQYVTVQSQRRVPVKMSTSLLAEAPHATLHPPSSDPAPDRQCKRSSKPGSQGLDSIPKTTKGEKATHLALTLTLTLTLNPDPSQISNRHPNPNPNSRPRPLALNPQLRPRQLTPLPTAPQTNPARSG